MMENPSVFGEQQYSDKQIAAKRKELEKLEQEKDYLENNVIYRNAFEWRFELPEVLDEKGRFTGFDVVIGNPPYGVLEKERNSPLEPYKSIIEYCQKTRNYSQVEGGKLNLYRLFIKLSYDISGQNSEFAFIVPFSLLGDNNLFSIRNFIFKNFDNIKTVCFPQKDNPNERVFPDAKQSALIIIGSIKKLSNSKNGNIQVYTYPRNTFKNYYKGYKTNCSEITEFDPIKLRIPLVTQPEFNILNKIHKNKTIREEENIEVRRGEINQTTFKKYITTNNNYKELIKGVEIAQYKINTKLSQGEKNYFNEELYLNDGKTNDLIKHRRIATQRITGVVERLRLVETIVESGKYFADSTNSIHLHKEDDYDLEFLLGLINSKLYQWRFKKTSSNNNVSTTEIESLPFPVVKNSDGISKKVSEVIDINKRQPATDTWQIEKEIDQKVYELYGLTEEEVEIVENSL